MCTEDDIAQMTRLSRRGFAAMSGFGALAACAPMGQVVAGPNGLIESSVTFDAPGGEQDGIFIHPAVGEYPGIIFWPDIAGLRSAPVVMARRLAQSGYSVLVVNPYYRSIAGQQFESFADFMAKGGGKLVAPWREKHTPQAIAEDAQAIVQWLDRQDAVDAGRNIGAQGYCMTGGWAIYAGAAVPARVKGMASFHGGNLVSDDATAPVNRIPELAEDAHALIAIARSDHEKEPDAMDKLRAEAARAGRDVTVELFEAGHGWTVPDSPRYDQAEADRAWAALLALYSKAL